MKRAVIVIVLGLSGCASSQQEAAEVAQTEMPREKTPGNYP